MRSLLIASFLVFSLSALSEADTLVIEDVRYGWLSSDGPEYAPVSNPSSVSVISFVVHKSQGDLIRLCCQEPFDIWVNQRLELSKAIGCIEFNLKELEHGSKSDSLIFQVASSTGLKGLTSEILLIEDGSTAGLNFDTRSRAGSNLFLTGILIIILLVGLLRFTFPGRMAQLLVNPFSSRGSLDDQYTSFFDVSNLLFLSALAFMSALTIYYVDLKHGAIPQASYFSAAINLSTLLGSSLAFVLFKYLIAYITSSIYGFRGIYNYQNQDFMNYSFWTLVLLLIWAMIDFVSGEITSGIGLHVPLYIVGISLIVFQIGITLKFVRVIPRDKMLIISYICATEFLPAFTVFYLLKSW